MVARKGKVDGGIRILDESKLSKNAELEFKGEGNEFKRMAKLSRDLGRISLSRKSELFNASAKPKEQNHLENNKGKMKSGRKALADIGNLNNRKCQQSTSQLSNKPKLICWKEKIDGTKKVTLEGSKISRGHGRLSLAKGIVIADSSLTKSTRENLERCAQISERLKISGRRKTSCPSKENKIVLPNFGSNVRKIHAGQLPQTRFVVGTKKVANNAPTTRKPVEENLERCAQISERLKFFGRRKTSCLSKENKIVLPNFGSNVRKIQVVQLPQTRFVVGTKKVANNAPATRKPVEENLERCAQISGRFKISGRRKTSCLSKENKIVLPNFGSNVRKIHVGQLPQTRFVVATKKVANKAPATRKSVAGSPKLRRSVMTRKTCITNKFETTKHSWNKEVDEPGTSNYYANSKVSQDVVLQINDINFSKDIVEKVVSVCKCNRRKSYTLSLMIQRGSDGMVNNDFLASIDDFSNPLEVAEYVDDIYQYYWTMEIERPSLANYREIQSEITPKMRSVLVNWLIEVHHKYKLMEESLFLMIEMLDKLLSIINIKKNELQLFGLTALLLASKYEDYWHPKVDELISLSVNQYTKNEMLGLEMFILEKLQFRLNIPTPYVFMLRFLRAAQSDKKLEHLSFYLIELCLMEDEALKHKASLLCASAIFVARFTLKLNPPWTRLLSKHTRYEDSELRNCAEMILRFQRVAACCKPVKYTYQKYLTADRSCVSLIKPMNVLPP